MSTAKASDSLNRITPIQALLLGGTLLNAIAFFAALPFAPLYLSAHTQLDSAGIGAVVGGIALLASAGGVLGGLLVDRNGAVPSMLVGLSLYIGIYSALAVVSKPALMIVLLLSLGIARLFVEPGGKKLMSLADPGGLIFRYRYMALCTGAILGPALGGVLFALNPIAFFAVPAIFYAAYFLLILSNRSKLEAISSDAKSPVSAGFIGQAFRDIGLIKATLAGVAIFFVFSQLESILPLYFEAQWASDAVPIFASLFVANAVMALVLQVPIAWVAERIARVAVILIGCFSFAIAFACFYAASDVGVPLLYVAVLFWTIGEGTLLPLPDIAIHELASDASKGTYYGVAELRYLGFFLGPIVGGLLVSNHLAYFSLMSLAVFLCVPLLRSSMRSKSEPVE